MKQIVWSKWSNLSGLASLITIDHNLEL